MSTSFMFHPLPLPHNKKHVWKKKKKKKLHFQPWPKNIQAHAPQTQHFRGTRGLVSPLWGRPCPLGRPPFCTWLPALTAADSPTLWRENDGWTTLINNIFFVGNLFSDTNIFQSAKIDPELVDDWGPKCLGKEGPGVERFYAILWSSGLAASLA